MNILFVHAHPETQSFCSAMKNSACELLRTQGHTVVVSDLHAMHWQPVASAADFSLRENPDYLVYALEQRHAYQTKTLAADIHGELEKLLAADAVIFNFPLYWFSVPAILKGWFDRVLLSGVCYGGKRFYDQGGLRGKRALLSLTLGGREHMFTQDGVHGALNDILRPILRGTLAYTGMDVLAPFAAYHVPYLEPAARTQLLDDYCCYIAQLFELTPLTGVSLSDFDAQLYPKNKARG